jgi:formate-dependent nitrite reductase membrane component NrfD
MSRRGGRGEVALVPEMTPTSYYGHPVLKPPVWEPEIGVYFFTGGLAAGSAMLAAAARARGNDVLARRALFAAFAGVAVSPPLLIKDLGVPRRFHNMLRVFKPTSPMNMGTWILSGAGTAIGTATACEVLGILPRVKRLAEVGAALLGPPLATYTAVLLADTAVPAWHEARHQLPFVFAGSAMASAGAAAVVLTAPSQAQMARTLAVTGVALELGAVAVMERRLDPEVVEPYHAGPSGRVGRLAKLLSGGGAAALAVAGGRARRRPVAVAGGLAVLAGSMCERWSVFSAGRPSASDPAYTVAPQRRRIEEGHTRGA